MHPDGTDRRRLIQSAEDLSPRFSLDGRRVAHCEASRGGGRISVVDLIAASLARGRVGQVPGGGSRDAPATKRGNPDARPGKNLQAVSHRASGLEIDMLESVNGLDVQDPAVGRP